jgi:hypothetical protein
LCLCLDRRTAENFTVLVGTVALNSGGVIHSADAIKMHAGYNPDNMYKDDIALVKVSFLH